MFQITSSSKNGYVHFEVSGESSRSALKNLIDQIAGHCDSTNTKKVLVDMMKVAPSPSPSERFFAGSYAADNIRAGIRIAVLSPRKHINKLTENTATNRGLQILVISDRQKAMDWLTGSS